MSSGSVETDDGEIGEKQDQTGKPQCTARHLAFGYDVLFFLCNAMRRKYLDLWKHNAIDLPVLEIASMRGFATKYHRRDLKFEQAPMPCLEVLWLPFFKRGLPNFA